MPRMLGSGSAGDDVKFLQQQLNRHPPFNFTRHGHSVLGTITVRLDINGTFDATTEAQVRTFQRFRGLVPDGVVGPLTWGRLLGHTVITTTGFCLLGRDLYDPFGASVVLRGINKMSVFDANDPQGLVSFPEIKKTGANTVRFVWAITSDLSPGGTKTSTATLDALITNAKANHLIPMIELHDATGDWTRLNDLITYWTQPAVVSIIQKHEQYLLVNIGNEVGTDTVTQADFVAGYSSAVQRMRTAGIHTPLIIDASDWGKNLTMLNNTAATLIAADPDGNLMFSVHLYWSLSCGADAAFIRSNLQQAVSIGYPLIVGEFSQYGGYPCSDPAASICSAAAEIDYQTILSVCYDLDLGWYAWEWGPGNGYFDPLCAVMDMTPDSLYANLKPGWAQDVAITSPYGIQKTSVTPAFI